MTVNFKNLFFETFPPRIAVDILRMVESGELSSTTGRKLMGAYVSAHCRMLTSVEAFFNPRQTLQEEIDREFKK
jgi:hypothetical protein